LAIVAQEEKPQVIRFAKVIVEKGETETDKFIEPLKKFVSRLEKEPETTKGYIQVPDNIELGKRLRMIVVAAGMESRVRFSDALKYPEHYWFPGSVYLYLIPQGAELYAIQERDPCLCPTLDIDAPEKVINRNSILTFRVNVGYGDIEGLKYTWTVSAGKIVEGQGTTIIKVDAEGAKEVTATVQIGGFCETCNRTVSFTTKIQ